MSVFDQFQLFRRILAICPCCGEIHRVSDLHLSAKGKAEKTWLDEYDADSLKLATKEEEFDQIEEKLREEAKEKGRKQAAKVFQKAICPSLQKLKLNPYDVKPIFHPIDFVAFNGMTDQEEISNILLLTREQCAALDPIRKQIKKAVDSYKYDWQVARIDDTGNINLE